MLPEVVCYKRHCKHFGGPKSINGKIKDYYCMAFPDRIPSEIVIGKNIHEIPTKHQKNSIVFER